MAKGNRKAWAKLRVAGIRTSKERVRRFMREHDLQAPHRVGQAHGPKAHDGTITTEAPDAMCGTDMTATVTLGEGSAFVFVAVDHCTTECIGLPAAKRWRRFEALEPIRQGARERFGAIGQGVAHGLRLRHDHGSNSLADDFQQAVAFFGIESSPSRGWLRLHEKGGTRHDVPAHHQAAEALDDYLELAGLDEAKAALFQSVDPAGRRLTGRAFSRRLVLAVIKRRAAAADLPPSTCCHTFRATGITAYLSNGGTLEHAQQIAGHASPKTTKLYDRTADTITVDEIERIVI